MQQYLIHVLPKCFRSGISVVNGSPTIKDNLIHDIDNQGIFVGSGTPLIEANTIYNNIDGIITDYASSVIKRNLIYNNSRYGIANRHANNQGQVAIIDHNTIDNNRDAGINCGNSNPVITNNIITNTYLAGGACNGSGIRATQNGYPTSRYNDLWNNSGGNYCDTGDGGILSKEGDISANPMYVDAPNGDYHLQVNSPCIDAGDPNSELDSDGTRSDVGALPFGSVTSVEDIESGGSINAFSLLQNYPNPFNPTTRLRYNLPEQAFVQLAIYDLLGSQVTMLVNQVEELGFRTVSWNGTDAGGKAVSAGMYLYVIKAGDFVQTRKMILLK